MITPPPGIRIQRLLPQFPHGKKLRYFSDGMLSAENVLNLHQRFWRIDGRQLVEYIPDPATTVGLHVRGKLVDGLERTTL